MTDIRHVLLNRPLVDSSAQSAQTKFVVVSLGLFWGLGDLAATNV